MVKTLDGRSYLTIQHLENELGELLVENAGRLGLDDLASLLGITSDVLDPFINKYCFKTKAEVVNGQLVTQSYLTETVDEIAAYVETKGFVSI